MKKLSPLIIVPIVSVLFLLNASVFIVNETEQVIITQFGKPVGQPIITSGIQFKIPFIQQVHVFDRRFLEWDGAPNQIPTKDKRFIWVDTYARWRIKDPLLFFQRVRDERGAQSRLDDVLDGETRNAIAKQNLVELVRNTNREQLFSEDFSSGDQTNNLAKIQVGRDKITQFIIKAYNLLDKRSSMNLYHSNYLRFAMCSTIFILFHELHMSIWNTKSILPILFLNIAIFKRYLFVNPRSFVRFQ